MAINKPVTFKGITLNDAYHRIDWMNLNGLNGSWSLEVQVGTYMNAAEALPHDNYLPPRKSYVLPITKDKVSLAEAYKELAKLPEFAGGTEV